VRITVALQTLTIAWRGHRSGTLMFLMTRGAGSFVHDIWLMKRITGMTFLAALIDSLIRQLQRRARERLIHWFMALRAVIGEMRVMT
jgi:hypothetical protein